MLSILRKASLPCIKFKFIEIQLQKNVQHHSKPFIFGKNFRITPVRSCQSKPNKEGKQKSFEYTPGTSPVDFMKHGKKKKIPLYQQMTGKTGQLTYSVFYAVGLIVIFAVSMSNFTWNSSNILLYFERQETKLPRKLALPYRYENKKEVYYVRFDLMLLVESVLSDLNFNARKQEDLEIFTADSLKTVGYGYTCINYATILGLPYFFEWKTIEDVNLKAIHHNWPYHYGNRFTNHSLTLDNLKLTESELQELKETFLLSNNAKKFAIAQKIIESESVGNWAFYSFVPGAVFWGLNQFCVLTNNIWGMLERPTYARYAMYSVHSAMFLSVWLYLFSIYQNEIDKWLDQKMILMGRDYLEGGTEFYQKEIKRGLLLRKGLEDLGPNYFDENGELERMWFEPTMESTPDSISKSRVKEYEQLLV